MIQLLLSVPSFNRVSVAIQFTSHVLPPSSENACSKWQELGVMSSRDHSKPFGRLLAVSLCLCG